MEELIKHFAETSFMPHGHCYFWKPSILWSYAVSDSIIALAYLVIPLSLVRIVRKRNDVTYMWMLALFAVFILGCGTTHVFDVINIWQPLYQYDVGVRIITALASIGTAVTLVAITPRLILIPSAKQWEMIHEELRTLNEDLEKKVQERTAELLESAAQFEFLTDAIPQIIWTANAQGDIDYYNKNWYEYTGLTYQESKNEGWKTPVHPDDFDVIYKEFQHAIKTGSKYEMEFRLKNATDHNYRWHLSRALPMKDENGNIIKWFGTATDVHDQKLQHEELKRVNEELDNFVYTASHDLKAPISNLDGLLHMVYNKIIEQAAQDLLPLLGMMKKQVEKLTDIIHDLSDVGRIHREAVEDFERVDVKALLEEFQVSHQEIIEHTAATLQADFQQSEFFFSKRLLRSLMHNLLDNAIKYRAPDRGPLIKVKTIEQGNYFVLTVEDNGIGIKEEHISKIFGMFTRFNREQEGTGIGLYMVKRITEKYHGRVEVVSRLGKGSVFSVFLKKVS